MLHNLSITCVRITWVGVGVWNSKWFLFQVHHVFFCTALLPSFTNLPVWFMLSMYIVNRLFFWYPRYHIPLIVDYILLRSDAKFSKLPLSLRHRLDCNAGDGVKVLVPIRPIAVLNGSIDLPAGDNVLSLLWKVLTMEASVGKGFWCKHHWPLGSRIKKQSICSYQQIEPIKLESQNLFAIHVWVGWSYHGARALYQLFANCIVCSSFVRLWRRLDTQWNISSSLVEIFQTELTNSWSVRWSHPFHKS